VRNPIRAITCPHVAHGELRRVLSDLVEVAVWTSPDGCWQEHATFLLGTADGRWHEMGFTDPQASVLLRHLESLPGYRPDRLFDVLGPGVDRVQALWHRPQPRPVPADREVGSAREVAPFAEVAPAREVGSAREVAPAREGAPFRDIPTGAIPAQRHASVERPAPTQRARTLG
jgi:hypothetical protein